MGRTKVRKYLKITDAQAVWKEYSEYMTTASWQVKVINPTPYSTICNPEPSPSCVVDTPIHQSQPVHHPDICPLPDDPPQNVDKSFHLSDPISTTDSLVESSTLSVSDDHLLHLDTASLSSELQTNSSVDCVNSSVGFVEIEFLADSEGQLGHANHSPADVFNEHHDYELFLLQKKIDAPYDNLSHQDTQVCEEQDQEDIFIHAKILCHTFALPQFMAQHNCEYLNPTETPSAVQTAFQASSNNTFNPKSAHNLLVFQCNQSQYLPMMKLNCAHNPSTSQLSQTNPLVSPYPPDPGEHVVKRCATEVGEQDFSVKWLKFIHPSPKQRMTETQVQKPVHVVYSPIASMKYKWTISLRDGYAHLHILQPEEYIPPSL